MSYKPDEFKIWNEGITQTYINDGIHSPEKIRTKWNANYNLIEGAKINIDTLNNHGKKTKVRIGLTNDELSRLVTMLKTPAVDIPIDQRLTQDFIQQPAPRLLNGKGHTTKTRHYRHPRNRRRFTRRNKLRNTSKQQFWKKNNRHNTYNERVY
jgi:hypothetical protein